MTDTDWAEVRARSLAAGFQCSGVTDGGISCSCTHVCDRLRGEIFRALMEASLNHTPTQWAYDQACAALRKHKDRAERVTAALEALISLHDLQRSDYTVAEYTAMEQGALESARDALSSWAKYVMGE